MNVDSNQCDIPRMQAILEALKDCLCLKRMNLRISYFSIIGCITRKANVMSSVDAASRAVVPISHSNPGIDTSSHTIYSS